MANQSALRRTFTLVELICLLAVVLVLLGCLFPILERARGKARQANCMNTLRKITGAVGLYSRDNDGVLPLDSDQVQRPKTLWTHRVQPYLGGDIRKLFHDPGMPQSFDFSDDTQSHYLFNQALNAREDHRRSLAMGDLTSPRDTMMLICGSQGARCGSVPELLAGQLMFPHPELYSTANLVFADGHSTVRHLDQISVNENVRFWSPNDAGIAP